jgi:four helix bundle protein
MVWFNPIKETVIEKINLNQEPRVKNQEPNTKIKTELENFVLYEINEIKPLVFQVQEAKSRDTVDLKKRTFDFAINVLRLLRTIQNTKENDVIKYQLSKSSTSIGANYEESQATNSHADFRHKIGICLKEVRESNYWLRIMEELKVGSDEEIVKLINESGELKLILGSIYNKVSNKS